MLPLQAWTRGLRETGGLFFRYSPFLCEYLAVVKFDGLFPVVFSFKALVVVEPPERLFSDIEPEPYVMCFVEHSLIDPFETGFLRELRSSRLHSLG